VSVDPIVATPPTPDPKPGPAPASQATKASSPPMQPDHVEKSGPGGDPGAMLHALEQHAQTFASGAVATASRGLQAASKAAPEMIDGATTRMAGLASVVLSIPGDVPHDVQHGYGVAAPHPAARTATFASPARDARTIAKATAGLRVAKLPCRKPPKEVTDKVRSNFNATDKPAYVRHLVATRTADLKNLGFTDGDLSYMASSGKIPRRYNIEVHHRLPIDCGGTNDFKNLNLVRQSAHKLFNEAQVAATKGMQAGDQRPVELLELPEGDLVFPRNALVK